MSCSPLASTSVQITSSNNFTATSSFVKRSGSELLIDDQTFFAAGPNIYWLGLDENVGPISYPSSNRVYEVLATAAATGASAVRSTTLGVSVGCPLCILPDVTINIEALQAVDLAVYAASIYGLKLIIPLVDQYDYYHGGIASFLRNRNLSDTNFTPFYDNTTSVYQDFFYYFESILNHTSIYTNITLRDDPTIMAWETGNELHDPPISWTDAVSTRLKQLAPNHLVIDGSYGVNPAALGLPNVDIYSDHFYPPSKNRLRDGASATVSAGKVYLVGEFDWTDRWSRLPLLLGLVPVIFALLVFCLPPSWFGRRIYLPARLKRSSKIYLRTPPSPTPRDTDSIKLSPVPDLSPVVLTSSAVPPGFRLRKWHISVALLLLVPVIEGIVLAVRPVNRASFLSSMSNTKGVSGDLYWSLFGRDNNCCQFVQHNDGFTLHVDTTDKDMQSRARQLAQHAYQMNPRAPTFLSANALSSVGNMPGISCPQIVPNVTVYSPVL